eukprot:2541990-Rhodomonas_salina.1
MARAGGAECCCVCRVSPGMRLRVAPYHASTNAQYEASIPWYAPTRSTLPMPVLMSCMVLVSP